MRASPRLPLRGPWDTCEAARRGRYVREIVEKLRRRTSEPKRPAVRLVRLLSPSD